MRRKLGREVVYVERAGDASAKWLFWVHSSAPESPRCMRPAAVRRRGATYSENSGSCGP